jgi:hypothetical protein
MDGDAPRLADLAAVDLSDGVIDPGEQRGALVFGRLQLSLGRHFGGPKHVLDVTPCLVLRRQIQLVSRILQPHFSFRALLAVTTGAVGLQQWPRDLIVIDRPAELGARRDAEHQHRSQAACQARRDPLPAPKSIVMWFVFVALSTGVVTSHLFLARQIRPVRRGIRAVTHASASRLRGCVGRDRGGGTIVARGAAQRNGRGRFRHCIKIRLAEHRKSARRNPYAYLVPDLAPTW